MATLAFLAVAQGAGWSSLATAAGTAFFSFVDSRYVLPGLFPPPDAPRPNLGDLQFQFAEEGETIGYGLGSEIPITGGAIWASEVIVVPIEQDTGGCGGSQVSGYEYFRHVQILFCECDPVTGIDGVSKVFKDGQLFWDESPDVDITSTQLSAVVYEEIEAASDVFSATNTAPIRVRAAIVVSTGDRVRVTGCLGNTAANGSWTVTKIVDVPEFDLDGSTGNGTYVGGSGTVGLINPELEIQSPSGGPDLTALRSGIDTTITGWTTTATANNGTWKCITTGNLSGGGTFARFEHPNPVAKAAGDTVHLVQDVPQWSLADATDVSFTLGGASEVPHPLVESIEGVGEVPAYRGRGTMVIERLALDGPGRVPEFRVVYRQRAGAVPVATSISDALDRGGFDSDEYDVAEVTGNLTGLSIAGGGNTIELLQPISIAHDVLAQEKDGVVRFFDRTAATVYALSTADLAAHSDGDAHPAIVDFRDPPDEVLPDEMTVRYMDPEKEWQSDLQRERKYRGVAGREVAQVSLPLVLSRGEGRGLARRLLWLAWNQRHRPSFALPPSQLYLCEGDVVTFDAYGESWRMLLRKLDIGTNWLIKCEAEIDDIELSEILSGPFDPPGGDEPPPVAAPGETAIVLANLPPLVSAHVGKVGFYYGVALLDRAEIFNGMSLYASDDGTTYNVVDQPVGETAIGSSSSILSGSGIDTHFFDELHTVDVVLKEGELASTTENLVLSGANRALLGNEVIAFKTAVLIAPYTYTLSGLLRGLYDTQNEVSRHLGGERFMLLNSLGMRFMELSLSQLLNERHYRAVTAGYSVTQASDHLFTTDGTSVRHWAPCQAILKKDASSGDLTIRWTRRCLAPIRLFEPTPPLFDTQESYEVDIYSSSTFTTLLRTLTASSESVLYSQADQTTDATGPSFFLMIYQIHSLSGRSKPLTESGILVTRTSD